MPHADFPDDAAMADRPPRALTPRGPGHQHFTTANNLWLVEVEKGPHGFLRVWYAKQNPAHPGLPIDHAHHPHMLVHRAHWQTSSLWPAVRDKGQLRLAIRAAIERAEP